MSYLDIFLLILVRVKGTVSIVRKPRPPSTWPLPPVLPGALQGISRPAEGHSPSNVLRSAPRPPLSWACPKHLPSTLTSWPMAREKTNCCSCVCLWYWLFGRDPKLINIRQSQNVDRLVNWALPSIPKIFELLHYGISSWPGVGNPHFPCWTLTITNSHALQLPEESLLIH